MENCDKGHEGMCCCGCKYQLELFKHPWNKENKGSISESTGMFVCTIFHNMDNSYKGIIYETGHGMCEMHDKRK